MRKAFAVLAVAVLAGCGSQPSQKVVPASPPTTVTVPCPDTQSGVAGNLETGATVPVQAAVCTSG